MAYVELMEINMIQEYIFLNMTFSMVRKDLCLFSIYFSALCSAQW